LTAIDDNMDEVRRHAAPPESNFEIFRDVLMKRKGMKIDVSSSGKLADSLDKCVVRVLVCRDHEILTWVSTSTLRIRMILLSIPWSESWQRDVCYQQSISALETFRKIISDITVSLQRYTLTLPLPSVVTLASIFHRRLSHHFNF
jgi:hypothetical protein